ncbi:MAG: hypothetical protein KJZ68_12145 [Phycisphaerales bacterium]|nr:hypothetical protein [Phycisphaerales bacterium]
MVSFTWFVTGMVAAAAGSGSPDKVDFVTQIRPIFESRCIECHGERVKKGGLRLDRRSQVFHAGGPDKWAIRPGDPAGSAVFERISLPADDLDIMPAEGDPLTPAQIDLIRRWIEEGAEWPEDAPEQGKEDARVVIPPLTTAEQAAEAAAIERLRQRGVLAQRIASDTSALYVNFSLLGKELTGDDLTLLAGLEPTLAWLNLGRTPVKDEWLSHLPRFRQLRRIHLQQSGVTDEGLRHLAPLEELRYLNLYGTNVTDAGLAHLRKLAKLRNLYLWRTGVTEEDVSALQAVLPELRIDTGRGTLVTPVETAAESAQRELTCCEKAKAAGKECDHPCCIEAAKKGEVCLKCNPKGAPGP